MRAPARLLCLTREVATAVPASKQQPRRRNLDVFRHLCRHSDAEMRFCAWQLPAQRDREAFAIVGKAWQRVERVQASVPFSLQRELRKGDSQEVGILMPNKDPHPGPLPEGEGVV